MIDATVVVMAKAPRPGVCKTRLCPPLSLTEAAEVAEASLRDTLREVGRARIARHVLALDGPAGAWLPAGIDVVPQGDGGLDVRIARVIGGIDGPVLVIGMDTPQVTGFLLEACVRVTVVQGAALGLAADGGWWALGLRRPDPRAVLGVPMSTRVTGRAQIARLRALGLTGASLPVLRDVDVIEDAIAVAAEAPATAFAGVVRRLRGEEAWRTATPAVGTG